MKQETVDATMAAIGGKTTYAGGGMAVGGWYLSNEFFGIAGLCIGAIGLWINWYFRRKQDRRDQREYEARMRAMGQEP